MYGTWLFTSIGLSNTTAPQFDWIRTLVFSGSGSSGGFSTIISQKQLVLSHFQRRDAQHDQ
jgi:hypothetical protein